MVELRNERIQQMLREETPKTEEVKTILRCVYTRYMRLFEKYFADIDALNDDRIAELKQYFEETKSLGKYYYMDIPQEICEGLSMFDDAYIAELLGSNWHKYIFDSYKNFRDENDEDGKKSEERCKAEFTEQVLTAFYETMDSIFREGFGTDSKTGEKVFSGLSDLLFGGKE